MKRSAWSGRMALLFAVMATLGCATAFAETGSPEKKTLSLTLMTVDSTASGYANWVASVEAACNIKINTINCPTNTNDRQTKITTILSSSDKNVDVITVNDEMYTAYKNTGWLTPLQKTTMTPDIMKNYPEIYMKDMVITKKGEVFSVPMYFSVLGFFVNQAKLKEAGMTSIKTYDDFLKFVKATTKDGTFGYGGAWEATYVFNELGTFVNLFGGDYYDWKNPKTQNAIKLLYDMCHGMKVTPLAQLADQYDPLRQKLVDGTVASCFLYNGQIAKIAAAGKYGDSAIKMVIPPKFETCSAYCSSWHYVLNAASKNKEAALRFLKYSTTKEAYLAYAKAFGKVPARLDVIMDPSFKMTAIDEFREYIKNVTLRGRPIVPQSMEFISGIGSLFQRLVTDAISMDVFFDLAQKETERYF